MFLLSIVQILYYATVLSAVSIPITTEKPHSLQRDTVVTSKTDVHDVSGLFEPSEKSVNATKQILEQRPIALEGGSSVIANDSTVSENSAKELDQKTTSAHTSFESDTVIKSNTFHKAIQTEGGILEIPVSTAAVGETTKLVPDGSNDFINDSFQLNVEDESDDPSVVPRKGVSPKIVARKGAEPYEPFSDHEDNGELKQPECNCQTRSSEQNSGNFTENPTCELFCNTSDSQSPSISTTALKNDSTDIKTAANSSNDDDLKIVDSNVNGTDIKNETTLLNVSNSTFNDVYRAYPPLQKKSKPLVTSDTDSDQKQQKIPASSSSEKSDFVIPVVLLILAVPVVVVLAMLFYRKGTEFWERRHYSKMDFLIDGMYNE